MNKYEQLIEAIISEDEAQAKELFHQIVVEKSRDIYESLMDEEATDEDADAEALADEVEADEVSEEFDITAEEAKSLMDYVDSGLAEGVDAELLERVAQYFGVTVQEGLLSKLEESSDQLLDIAYGAQEVAEEGDEEMPAMDMEMGGEEEAEEGDEEAEEEAEEELEDRVMDLESALDDLKAEFDALMADEAGEEEHNDGVNDPEMGDEEAEEEMAEEAVAEEQVEEDNGDDELAKLREYVEKVAGVSNQEGADNKQSTVASKNDMGGDAGNTAQGGEESGRPAPKAAPIASGNKNVPGGSAGLEKA